jgi:serine/threonine protein phosphatase PrpC
MMTSGKNIQALGERVLGAVHAAQNKPCQDALHIVRHADYLIACVADGHGSVRCPYSDEGAEAAVQAVTELLVSIMENGNEAFAVLDAHREIRLPKQLEERWKTRIRALHASKEDGFGYELYGTTLLALAVRDCFVFALQIGDGDILAVSPYASATWLIPAQETIGSETESLCMENCWQYIRTRLLPLQDIKVPLMFLLATDGYANSFTEPAGFLQAGDDICSLWQTEGADHIKENLYDWLTLSSEKGSGDDIAMALVMME